MGPLVLGGVWLSPRSESKLLSLGVRDSKSFGSSQKAREQRKRIADHIRAVADCFIIAYAGAEAIDRRVWKHELNQLEREMCTAVIRKGPCADVIIADGNRLFAPLQRSFEQLKAYDKAEIRFPAVAAASILAKTARDEAVEAMLRPFSDELGPIHGNGYPNAGTARFFRSFKARYGCLPPGVRISWRWSVLKALRGFDNLGKVGERDPQCCHVEF